MSHTGLNHVESGMLASIQNCVEAVSWSCQHLELANASVSEATADMPRLKRVLANKRHFDLVSVSEIAKARDHLSAEIQPQILQLVEKAKENLEREERQMKTLRNKTMQLQSQLAELGIKLDSAPSARHEPVKSSASVAADREVQMLRAKVTAAKKRRELFTREVLALEKEITSV